ncbi:MAG TPA: hypothetical protein VK061_03410 [Bacillota bacterium]|nr:hypothetical protein [Bacillota bacterium]
MHIGVFTALDNKERLKKLLETFEDVTFEFFPYEKVEEVTESFEKNARFLDGYLFSGYLSYWLIKDLFGKFDKPVVYLKMSDADFYKKLIYIMMRDRDIDLSRVFIDFHAESEAIADYINSLPEENRPLIAEDEHVYASDDVYERASKMHKEFHDDGKVDISFTRLANIIPQLEEHEIPYHYFDISDETIIETIEDLMNDVHIHLLQDNQIVSGAVKVRVDNEDLKEVRMLNLHSALLDYNYRDNHELIIHERDDYFEVMTNYMELEMLTNNFQSCSLLHFLQQKLSDSIHIGWGVGKTFAQARVNAQMACDYSYNNNVGSTYIIKNEERMIGPLVGKRHIPHATDSSLVSLAEIEKLTEKLDMTRDKLNKIFLSFNRVENDYISSSLFAETVGLSVRSANRILKEAEEKRLVIGMVDSSSGLQGRPRKLYRLNRDVL